MSSLASAGLGFDGRGFEGFAASGAPASTGAGGGAGGEGGVVGGGGVGAATAASIVVRGGGGSAAGTASVAPASSAAGATGLATASLVLGLGALPPRIAIAVTTMPAIAAIATPATTPQRVPRRAGGITIELAAAPIVVGGVIGARAVAAAYAAWLADAEAGGATLSSRDTALAMSQLPAPP